MPCSRGGSVPRGSALGGLLWGVSGPGGMPGGDPPRQLLLQAVCILLECILVNTVMTMAFFVSLPSPSPMGSITIRVSNGNSKNGYHGDQLDCSHCDSNDTEKYL